MRDEAEVSYTGARGIKFWCTRFQDQEARQVDRRRRAGRNTRFSPHRAQVDPKWLRARCAPAQARPQDRIGSGVAARSCARARHALRLPVYANRRVDFASFDASLARIFIRSALVGAISRRGAIFRPQPRLVAEIDASSTSRAADILVDEQLMHASTTRASARHIERADFDNWRKDASANFQAALPFKRRLMRHRRPASLRTIFRRRCSSDERLVLEYTSSRLAARRRHDDVPLALLNQCRRRVASGWCQDCSRRNQGHAKSIPQRLGTSSGRSTSPAAFCEQSASDTPLAAALAAHRESSISTPVDSFGPTLRRAPAYELRVVDDAGASSAWIAIWPS